MSGSNCCILTRIQDSRETDRTNPGTMARDKFEMIDEQAPHTNGCVQQEETDNTNSGMLTMPGKHEMQPLSPNGSAGGQEEKPEQKYLSLCYKYGKAIPVIRIVISHTILIVIIIVLACLLSFSYQANQKIQAVQMGRHMLLNSQHDDIKCPPDWVGHQGHCYKFSEKKKTWNESQNFCILHNASLVKITENKDFVKNFTSDRDFWIGLKRESNQPWKWLDGDNATSEDMGHEGEEGGGDCAYLDDSGEAYPRRCTFKQYFICEKNDPKRS